MYETMGIIGFITVCRYKSTNAGQDALSKRLPHYRYYYLFLRLLFHMIKLQIV